LHVTIGRQFVTLFHLWTIKAFAEGATSIATKTVCGAGRRCFTGVGWTEILQRKVQTGVLASRERQVERATGKR
jgi:hypothetical protein